MNFKLFQPYPQLTYGISTRADGSMKIWGDPKRDEPGLQKRRDYFKKLDIPFDRVVMMTQVHDTNIHLITNENAGTIIRDRDGLITTEPNLFLVASIADCFPIYFFDPVAKVVGVAHAGWRGIVRGIVREVVSELKKIGSHPNNVLVGIGPGIQACHFKIGDDTKSEFRAYEKFVRADNGETFVDLRGIIIKQSCDQGIPDTHIEWDMDCTYDLRDTYFSWRREQPKQQAMIAYIGMR